MGYAMAIDGPAGAGKSTIAKLTAKELGLIYIDTGAMYRGVALYFIDNNIDYTDENEAKKVCDNIDITIKYEDGIQQLILNGRNVTSLIRQEQVGKAASAVAKHSCIREKLVELQRRLAEDNNIIMDGRDIGTKVLPNANLKIYLTASSMVRAERRYNELKAKNIECDINEIEKDIIARDTEDMNREISPLRQASDAMLLDTSDMNIDEVVSYIKNIYRENMN